MEVNCIQGSAFAVDTSNKKDATGSVRQRWEKSISINEYGLLTLP